MAEFERFWWIGVCGLLFGAVGLSVAVMRGRTALRLQTNGLVAAVVAADSDGGHEVVIRNAGSTPLHWVVWPDGLVSSEAERAGETVRGGLVEVLEPGEEWRFSGPVHQGLLDSERFELDYVDAAGERYRTVAPGLAWCRVHDDRYRERYPFLDDRQLAALRA